MTTATGVRAGFTTITPYVTVVEVERLITFVKDAYGAEETGRSQHGGGGGLHCELRIGESMLMFGGGPAARGREKTQAFHYYVDDADAVYRRAVEAGGEGLGAPEERPYGERQGTVKDPGGNLWYIATHHGPRDRELRTVTPYLLRVNALGLIDFLKAAFNAKEIGVYKSPEGQVMHAALRIGDGALEMGEDEGHPSAFYLYVADVDAVYRQALAAGAKPLYQPTDQPFGDRIGAVEDAWANTWCIASHLGR